MVSTAAQATWILPMASTEADPARAGGKGANLARLVQAGLPVPDGFIITTEAYVAFAAANSLAEPIAAALQGAAAAGVGGLSRAA